MKNLKNAVLGITLLAMAFGVLGCSNVPQAADAKNPEDGTGSPSATIFYGAKVAATVAKLPPCDSTAQGMLFYVLSTEEFQYCTSSGFTAIDLQGATGATGAKGSVGGLGASCTVTSLDSIQTKIFCEDGTSSIVQNGETCSVSKDALAGVTTISCPNGTTALILDGIDGTNGTNGVDGLNGVNDVNGTDGVNGAPGTSFLSGTTDPTYGMGNEGDTYLNIATGEVFQKSGGWWTLTGTLFSSVNQSSSQNSNSSSSSAVVYPGNKLLWDLTVPYYEVQVPAVQDGSCGDPATCAGWWYGFGLNGGTYSPVNADMSLMTTDPLSGEIIPNGNLTSTGLKITLNAPAATATDKPGIAGLGFNFNKPEGPTNITAHDGYIITYTSDAALQFELGWDEVTNNLDTWYATLPAQATSATKTLPWAAFKKDGWGTGTKVWPITEAINNAWSLKIRLKNGTTTDKVAHFEIQSLQWIQ
jgi:hypothetical protein